MTKYAKYLEEKCSVYRLLGYQFEKNKTACKNIKAAKIKVVHKLQSQFNALLNIKVAFAPYPFTPFLSRDCANHDIDAKTFSCQELDYAQGLVISIKRLHCTLWRLKRRNYLLNGYEETHSYSANPRKTNFGA